MRRRAGEALQHEQFDGALEHVRLGEHRKSLSPYSGLGRWARIRRRVRMVPSGSEYRRIYQLHEIGRLEGGGPEQRQLDPLISWLHRVAELRDAVEPRPPHCFVKASCSTADFRVCVLRLAMLRRLSRNTLRRARNWWGDEIAVTV